VTFDRVTAMHAAYTALGVGTSTGITITNSVLSDNGVDAYADYHVLNLTIRDSEISRNNWRGHALGHKGWDTVFKIFGDRDVLISRVAFSDNKGNGFWVDSDNQRVTVEHSLMRGNTGKGVSLEKNQGPIVLTGNRICENLEGGVNDAQSDNVTLRNNQIFNNRDFNVAFGGVYAGQTFTNWQTGQSYTAKSINWTVEGNTVVGNGTGTYGTNGGWLWWHTDYQAPGAWALTRDTIRGMDSNRWYHKDQAAAFMLPGGAVGYSTFKSDLQRSNTMFEANSSWQAVSLSCTMP
jgi:hypothetical protein